jgi:uncharacterized protein (DUF952 family)
VTSEMHFDAESSRKAGIAYHLVPQPVWDSLKDKNLYEPEAYSQDGFIHLTLGLDPLLKVANMFYTSDDRNFTVLVLDMNRIQAPVRFEDPEEIYPHIYGLLNTDAVIGQLAVIRDENGKFLEIETA